MGDMTANFSRAEFACRCGCGADHIETELVERLQSLRDELLQPIHITSGVCCPEHNRKIGGARRSKHMTGEAADIAIADSAERYQVIDLVMERFLRIGVGNDFVHVDIADAPTPVLWTY